ncbi:MAG: hypothetical protein K6T66_10910 [Peptococcaceae bacterium]|nr:hypothetical protein [Peptococcaceae bacterium]
MKVAFHFDADHERFDRYDGLPVIKEVFRQLLRQDTANLHLKVFTGDIVALDYLKDKKNREEIWRGFFTPPRPVWQSLRPDFMNILYNKKVFVVAFEGMGSRLRDVLHEALLNDETYIGAQQIHEANPVHWVLYGASLIPLYRITGRDLRLFYSIGSDDEWDQALAVNFRDDLPFSSITFEEMSVPHTILDGYSSYEHASRVADLSTMLYDHLNLVADQVMLRLTDLAPDLYDRMHGTLLEFEDLDNPGGIARAAAACRKMLESLAGRLSPSGGSGGMFSDDCLDRIASYISERSGGAQKENLLSHLKDIASRIEKFVSADGKREDFDSVFEGGRLLLGLVIFTCDVLMLDPQKS